jgi:hypothetical protein
MFLLTGSSLAGTSLFGHRFRDKDAIGKMAQEVGLATPAQEDQR